MFATDCFEWFARLPLWRKPYKTLPDFGTGWGRIARCFVPPFAAERVTGVDPNADFLSYFRAAFPESRAILSNKEPPLPVPAGAIDFIVSYSVFSHRDEALCRAWITSSADCCGRTAWSRSHPPTPLLRQAAALTGPEP